MKRSKSYRQADEQIDHERLYSPAEAVAIAKAGKVTKFDPTVEVALRLGVDPRKQDQMVRGTVNLPNGTGKTARVLVFATGDRAEEARVAIAQYGVIVAPVCLGQRSTYVHALTMGQAAQEYEPHGKAAEEIVQLYMWTCQQVGLSSWRKAKR